MMNNKDHVTVQTFDTIYEVQAKIFHPEAL